ncbi:MAG: sigma-70 family RNA polymerase sigma factor [Planctomycetes bacterium]|nr:sigma-70 family RNA polymerase sigma factor [Planctomycetota bacterium]
MTDRLNHLLESTVYTQRRFDGLVRQWGQDDAEDLRQEAAIRLWQATARGNVHNPVGYFERSVKTCAIDRSRRRERRVKLVSAPRLRAPKAPTIVDWSKVRELIDMLPRTLRDTVRRWQSGMSVDNIAAKDNVPPTTVRKRLSRARRRISDLLLE